MGPHHDRPWWWRHLRLERAKCDLEYERLSYKERFPAEIPFLEVPLVMLLVLRGLMRWRHRANTYVFTIEFDWVGFSIAFWQTVTGMRTPRHVIIQFIMREKTDTWLSKAKYALMRILFQSVDRVVVSSELEGDYYRQVFKWNEGKVLFVPTFADPRLLEEAPFPEEDFYLAAGRTFRDYDTLVRAIVGTGLRVIIVAGEGSARRYAGTSNVQVLQNVPLRELEGLIQRSRAVVVPLEDRAISIGQSVVLQAMALGKAVVATRTAGTVDYIDDMVDGILVEPADDVAMRRALLLLESLELRRSLGENARRRVAERHLPEHFASSLRTALDSD